jgi:hypothetical protein
VSTGDRVSASVNQGQVMVHIGLDARVRPLPRGLRALDWPSARRRWWASSWVARVGGKSWPARLAREGFEKSAHDRLENGNYLLNFHNISQIAYQLEFKSNLNFERF